MIAESLNITAANAVCTPGGKPVDVGSEPKSKTSDSPENVDLDNDGGVSSFVDSESCDWSDARNLPELLSALTGESKLLRRNVTFSDVSSNHVVPSFHPPGFFVTKRGWRKAPAGMDKFTGMSHETILKRRQTLCFARHPEKVREYRQSVLRVANAILEADPVICTIEDVHAMVCATRTPPATKSKFKKREGARKVKDFEKARALEDGHLPRSLRLLIAR